MNIFQYAVVYSLAWLAILADGWLFHTGWIWALGLLAFIWILRKMYKEMKDGF